MLVSRPYLPLVLFWIFYRFELFIVAFLAQKRRFSLTPLSMVNPYMIYTRSSYVSVTFVISGIDYNAKYAGNIHLIN